MNFKITLALAAILTTASAKDFLVYFGTYTNALSEGIYVSRLNAETGKLTIPELAAAVANPCSVATSADEKFLYSANSKRYNHENFGSVSAFAIDKKSGRLKLLNEIPSGGNGPCYVGIDNFGKVLLAANYGGGSVKSFSLNVDGSIGDQGSRLQFYGHSTNTNRQAAPHAHFINPDPTGKFALVCDLGTDKISVYPIQTETATLDTNRVFEISVPPGSGARHLAFSRNGKFVYVLNEMACSVTTFLWNAGRLTEIKTSSLLPTNAPLSKAFTAAEIRVHPSGRFIYATIRGHDSVSVLAADEKNGELKLIQNLPSGGKVPRGLGLDPTGKWLLTGNQKSDRVVEFAIDSQTGMLTPTGATMNVGAPVDVNFISAE